MIDNVKKNMVAAAMDEDEEGGGGGGDNKQAQIDALNAKIDVIQKNNEIELRHAKELAAKNANELLDKKLSECKFAYEEELEAIADQFETI